MRRIGQVSGTWLFDGDRYTVRFYDYSEKRTSAYAAGELTASTGRTEPDCEVEWQGAWCAAQVLQQKDGKFHIHDLGYEASWDEWVGRERIRFTKEDAKPEPNNFTPTSRREAVRATSSWIRVLATLRVRR